MQPFLRPIISVFKVPTVIRRDIEGGLEKVSRLSFLLLTLERLERASKWQEPKRQAERLKTWTSARVKS